MLRPSRFARAAVAIPWLCAVALALLMSGCGSRVDVLAALPEGEANEVVSVLLDAGIDAAKTASKAGVAVSVRTAEFAQALNVLKARGLPRDRYDGMGQIFRKEGLVSSPLEERARYIYALSQELANTLTQMDGVIIARVHVVLPERGGVGEEATPSTAAVFIKNQPGYSLDALLPQIRRLVTHAIPGLAEDRVSVALINAQPAHATGGAPGEAAPAAGSRGESDSIPRVWALAGLAAVLLAALCGLAGRLFWRRMPAAWRDKAGRLLRRKPAADGADSP